LKYPLSVSSSSESKLKQTDNAPTKEASQKLSVSSSSESKLKLLS
jgi:hypothetical protein